MKPRPAAAPNTMNKHGLPEDEGRLHARLAAEAAASRPEFSQRLHDRIMQSVHAASPTAARRAQHRVAFRLGMAGSAAAVAVLLAVWLVRSADHDSTAGPTAPLAVPVVPDQEPAIGRGDDRETALTVVAADRLTALVDATVAGSQWAYLDHDARLAASMVLDHLPFELPIAEVP